MSVTVRFAPSPTGLLHVGNARVALLNRLFADSLGGRFLLRLDNTDAERSREEYISAIKRDLSWLGVGWEHTVRQSDRRHYYHTAMARLQAAGRVYPCYETTEELDEQRLFQRGKKQPRLYDRAALMLSKTDHVRLERKGHRPYWRFRIDPHDVQWEDLVRGSCFCHGIHLCDPVLRRADGSYLYMLPSVVDDIDFTITHVIRGEDHLTNTAIQIQIFHALGATPPHFAHLPLMRDVSGQGLSKRLGSLSLDALRWQGIEPIALASLLVTMGTIRPIRLHSAMGELAAAFDLRHYSHGTPRFDESELWQLNARWLHAVPFAAVKDRLIALGLSKVTEGFWNAVRANLDRLETAGTWWQICTSTIVPNPKIIDGPLCLLAAGLLPSEPWDKTTWSVWISAIKKKTGRTGRSLIRPLRLALTGQDTGPELSVLLPIIGRNRALVRLRQGRCRCTCTTAGSSGVYPVQKGHCGEEGPGSR